MRGHFWTKQNRSVLLRVAVSIKVDGNIMMSIICGKLLIYRTYFELLSQTVSGKRQASPLS